MKIQVKSDPRPLRRRSYMPTGDQLDAIYKGFKALEGVVELPPETLAWMRHIEQVKAKFKKS